MPTDLLHGLIDTPKAFGFALSLHVRESQSRLTFGRSLTNDLSELTANDFTVIVRHLPATPESIDEEQPVVSPTVVLAYEGRVDNRQEIAYALGSPRLASAPDGAVLAAAYDAWGPSLSAKVIGEYAYVAFDRRSRRLVAGQDSLGVRRIFYRSSGSRLWVTSNLRLLFQHFPGARPLYDRDVLREYFAGTMSPRSGRTIWKGILELGRGKALVQTRDELKQQTVWQPSEIGGDSFRSEGAVDEAFRHHLLNAVRAALRTPGPVLCDLSGGYDSSTVFSIAALLIQAGESRGPIIAWSHVNKRSNEAAFQEAVRLPFEVESHTLDWSDYLPFKSFTDTEIPSGGFVQMGAMDRAAREFAQTRGIRSHLTGQAADAILQKSGGGAPVYLADWFREGRFRDWSRHFLAYLTGGSFNAQQLIRQCTFGTLDLLVGLDAPIPGWLSPAFKSEIQQARTDFLDGQSRVFRSHARERIYRWTQCFIPYANGGVPDERLPFVHRPLVEFVLGLDWQYLMRPNEERLLMRRSLSQILPEQVRNARCRTAIGAVLYEGLRAAWPRISHLVTGQCLADLGVVELKPFQAALAAMRAGYDGPNGQISKTALYLETWFGVKELLDNRPAPLPTSAGTSELVGQLTI